MSLNQAEGKVFVKPIFVHTKNWPDPVEGGPDPKINYEKAYKEGIAGKLVTVIETSVDGKGYLVLAEQKEVGTYLWMIEKEDTVPGTYIPNSIEFPTDLIKSIIEEATKMKK